MTEETIDFLLRVRLPFNVFLPDILIPDRTNGTRQVREFHLIDIPRRNYAQYPPRARRRRSTADPLRPEQALRARQGGALPRQECLQRQRRQRRGRRLPRRSWRIRRSSRSCHASAPEDAGSRVEELRLRTGRGLPARPSRSRCATSAGSGMTRSPQSRRGELCAIGLD
ncbi:hypothetical protein EDB86DRAFT_2943448 [Lactarius hatsudake]|nr:hypothetical protein EDB86DRAFT_2943448 [Lactarius hatsudake]